MKMALDKKKREKKNINENDRNDEHGHDVDNDVDKKGKRVAKGIEEYFENFGYMNQQMHKVYAQSFVHDPKLWLKHYTRALMTFEKHHKLGQDIKMALQRIILQGTIKACKDGYYYNSYNGQRVDLQMRDLTPAPNNTFQYDNFGDVEMKVTILNSLSHVVPCKVYYNVIQGDCMDVALSIKDQFPHERVALLNSPTCQSLTHHVHHPTCIGISEEEEYIQRRSNLLQFLGHYETSTRNMNSYSGDNNMDNPSSHLSGLILRDVLVFRGSQENGYPFLSHPYKIDVVSVASETNPQVTDVNGEVRLSKAEELKMKGSIRTIFNICLKHRVHHLVLSAFMCEPFRNPPKHVAELFRKCLELDGYAPYFKSISFAISENHQSFKSHNLEGNLKPFCDVFHKSIIRSPSV